MRNSDTPTIIMLYIHTGELSDQWSSKHWKGGKCCHKHATPLFFDAWFRWNHPPPTCGQLFRPEQKPICYAIPGVEGVGWAEQRDWIVIHSCRAHQILTRLVLWSVKKSIQKVKGWVFGRHCACGRIFCYCQLCTISGHTRWKTDGTNLRLGIIPCSFLCL